MRNETEGHVVRLGSSHYAPSISDEGAITLAWVNRLNLSSNPPDALVIRFHSDVGISDLRESRIDPNTWIYQRRLAYETVRWGAIDGVTYIIPCTDLGMKDAYGRPVFRDENGSDFAVDWEAGTPESPTRVRLVNPVPAEEAGNG